MRHCADHVDHGIRQARVVERGVEPCVLGHDDPRRDSDDGGASRDVLHDDAPRTDPRVIADVNRADDASIRPDDHSVANLRVPHRALELRTPEIDPLVEKAIIADGRRLADHDAHTVIDDDPTSDRRGWMDLDAGHEAARVGEQPSAELVFAPPKGICCAVQPQRVQPRIHQEDLDE